jgi:hypothetical protein
MTASEFKKTWRADDQPLAVMPAEQLERFNMRASTKEFLATVGLPVYASPFLSFMDGKKFNTERYIVIGANRNGAPIVVDTGNNDRVELLNFQGSFQPVFINSSLEQLADFLVCYRDFEDALLSEQGDDGVLNSSFSDEQFEALKQQMETIDKPALEGFWKEELDILLADREDYLNG